MLFELVPIVARGRGLIIGERSVQSVVDRVQSLISPILWALGLELVEVQCVGQGARTVVRVLIDKPGGVTVTDCEQAHKALGPALDVADPFPHAYTLEVSSPGLDRPFKRLQDYQRAIGKEISVKLRQPLPIFRSHRQSSSLLQAKGDAFQRLCGRGGTSPAASCFFDSTALLVRLTLLGRGS
jgi:ribosome maturation factor RimP